MNSQMLLPFVEEHQTIVEKGKYYPLLAIDLERREDGWYSSLMTTTLRGGGVEPWRGPYPCRASAETNAAAFGRQSLVRNGLNELAEKIRTRFLPNLTERAR